MRGKRTEAEMGLVKRRWRELLYDVEFRELPFTKQGILLGVSPTTVSGWQAELNPSAWENIKKISIERVAPQSVKINDALYQKCLEGDVQAIKLWKESIEGWIPRQDTGILRARDKELDAMANEDLLKVILRDVGPEKVKEMLDAPSSPVDSLVGPLERQSESELAAIELKEMTGGDTVGEWEEGARKPPAGNTIYTRKGD